MMKRLVPYGVLLLSLLLLLPVGCSKKPAPPPEPVAPPAPPVEPVRPAELTPAPVPEKIVFEDAFFDFDKFSLRADVLVTMQRNAETLLEHPQLRILIEGHCDERGTVEYNLALGDRRARATKEFLIKYGVAVGRIETISYGEERPFAYGHNEEAWAQNRRAHFVIKE